jgi:hypothetical protein
MWCYEILVNNCSNYVPSKNDICCQTASSWVESTAGMVGINKSGPWAETSASPHNA